MAGVPRHELKYYISAAHAPLLMDKLERVLTRDEHGDSFNEYMVRSLYFDDEFNSAYFDKMLGVMDRDKYRIRTYALREDVIMLERKRKHDSLVEKTSVPISRRLADRLIEGDPSGLEKMEHPMLRELFVKMRLLSLKPTVVVDYDRTAYVHRAEHVRVTFDKRVRTGLMQRDMFDAELLTMGVLAPSRVILEVKFDTYLPSYIAALVGSIPTQCCAISKYAMCRRYTP